MAGNVPALWNAVCRDRVRWPAGQAVWLVQGISDTQTKKTFGKFGDKLAVTSSPGRQDLRRDERAGDFTDLAWQGC